MTVAIQQIPHLKYVRLIYIFKFLCAACKITVNAEYDFFEEKHAVRNYNNILKLH